ncbi:dehydrogenase with different specificitie [Lophiotrema nucula]|uniref:Dehydrogenase with different specificitie n=1 Tax=Lophiotrema nucula TaxID=690887 RepID=A0A6A5Z3G3_9PLEO|nr:dehydrogenase with different specificitie [Lophiotrema nucula]
MSKPTYPYDPSTSIPSLSGKTFLITGGTAGVGRESVLQLAQHNPSRILFTGRNATAAQALIADVKAKNPDVDVQFIKCDFTSLQSVHSGAQKILRENSRLDVLLCNAGIMAVAKGLTEDGYSNQFGVNHLAHALLIKLLLPLLQRTAKLPETSVRVVISSSQGAIFAPGIDFKALKSEHDMGVLGASRRYTESKLANLLYAISLSKKYPEITTVSIHPGIINTGLFDSVDGVLDKVLLHSTTFWRQISVADGAKNQLWAATVEERGLESGMFYEPVGRVGRRSKASRDEGLAEELWAWTEVELRDYN